MTISVQHLYFSWPDGTPVFSDLDTSFPPGRHGLIGLNGAGKSTLARLIAGDLDPAGGTVKVDGRLGYVPQRPREDLDDVARVLGISETLAALDAIENGSTSQADFDAVGDDWDIAERARATLDRLGLVSVPLDQLHSSLSGGERTLLDLAAALLDTPAALLLDEPSNHLDARGRDFLFRALAGFAGTLLVVTHDEELLRQLDDVAEIRDGDIRWFAGFDDYLERLTVEQQAAEREVRDAESTLRSEKRDVVSTQVKLAHRKAVGAKAEREKRVPRIVARGRKRTAEQSAGQLKNIHQDRLEKAAASLDEARERVRGDEPIVIDLPETRVPARRRVLSTADLVLAHVDRHVDLQIQGPERIRLAGPNGSGKSTLFATISGQLEPVRGSLDRHVPLRLLPQSAEILDDALSVAENVALQASTATPFEIRSRLAHFGFRGRRADLPAAGLSGGERLKATLACVLLAQPAPQLLLLDEPTNNLDRPSIDVLVEAVDSYEGALIVASHDESFCERIAVDRTVSLWR